jgi:hypothetical protein
MSTLVCSLCVYCYLLALYMLSVCCPCVGIISLLVNKAARNASVMRSLSRMQVLAAPTITHAVLSGVI